MLHKRGSITTLIFRYESALLMYEQLIESDPTNMVGLLFALFTLSSHAHVFRNILELVMLWQF